MSVANLNQLRNPGLIYFLFFFFPTIDASCQIYVMSITQDYATKILKYK